MWDRHFSTCIDDGEDNTTVPGPRCYTDGSLMAYDGSGIALCRQGIPAAIHTDSAFVGKATVFQAEVHAIFMA